MILRFFRVLLGYAHNHKRMLQRPKPHPYLAGAENLKGFGPLVMENESLEVEDPWFLMESYVC